MKPHLLLLAAALCGQYLNAQNAIKLSFSSNENVSTCKIDAKSFSTDSGTFFLFLNFREPNETPREQLERKWHGIPVLSMLSPRKSALHPEPLRDSIWTGDARAILHFEGDFLLKRSEIESLQINRIRSITLVYPNTQITLNLSRRSGKALMKLIGDHW